MLESHYWVAALLISSFVSFLAGWKLMAKRERNVGYMAALADHYNNVRRKYESSSVKKREKHHLKVVKGGVSNG